jgi:hypothetical protein
VIRKLGDMKCLLQDRKEGTFFSRQTKRNVLPNFFRDADVLPLMRAILTQYCNRKMSLCCSVALSLCCSFAIIFLLGLDFFYCRDFFYCTSIQVATVIPVFFPLFFGLT